MQITNALANRIMNDPNAKRGYEEIKDIASLNKVFDVIEEDVKELKPIMSTSDKQTAHNRMLALSNMFSV